MGVLSMKRCATSKKKYCWGSRVHRGGERWAFLPFSRTPCPASPGAHAGSCLCCCCCCHWCCHHRHCCQCRRAGPMETQSACFPGTGCSSTGGIYRLAAAVSRCCATVPYLGHSVLEGQSRCLGPDWCRASPWPARRPPWSWTRWGRCPPRCGAGLPVTKHRTTMTTWGPRMGCSTSLVPTQRRRATRPPEQLVLPARVVPRKGARCRRFRLGAEED